MIVVNWLLISLGNAVAWLGSGLGAICRLIGRYVNMVLDPILSRVLAVVNPICTVVGDGLYSVLSLLPAWLGLTLVSAAVGVLMLIAFRYTSNQAAIGRARDDITANLLALKLFKDEALVGLRSQGRLLAALARLQWHMLRPLLILLFPMLLIMAQMGARYQWRPLRPGEVSLLKLRLAGPADFDEIRLEPNPGVAIEAGPVPGNGELVWRLRAIAPGRHTLRVKLREIEVNKELVVGKPLERVSAERSKYDWITQIFNPVEPVLPSACPVSSVSVHYGAAHSYIYGANWWILYFFVVSMVFALLFRRVFNVRF